MKILLSISLLALSFPLAAESSSPETLESILYAQSIAESSRESSNDSTDLQEVADLDTPIEEAPEETKPSGPRHVSKASNRVNQRERSRHVLDVVLAGIVTVGTVIAIILL